MASFAGEHAGLDITILYIASAGSEWTLQGDDRPSTFGTRVAAIREAMLRLAEQKTNGRAAQLLVRRHDGAWEVIWAWEPETGD
jgi:hypothetical protein